MITIVNYGIGNLGSMLNMFRHIGVKATIESDPVIIQKAEKLVLPGVGSFDTAITRINSISGLREVLNYKALVERIPILGVCLGMQLLTRFSEEGRQPGLGWIPSCTRRFPRGSCLKIPHMGWNLALPNKKTSLLTKQLSDESRYYFVHSYYVQVDDPVHSLMRTRYNIDFDSAIGKDNIYGVQFHPEKSHKNGMQILKNFSSI
jgi:glutamine amidotransferase